MHVLAGKFAWRKEKKLRFNNNKKKPAKDCKKHWQCLEKNAPAGKIPESEFFLLAQNNNQEISALTCEKTWYQFLNFWLEFSRAVVRDGSKGILSYVK